MTKDIRSSSHSIKSSVEPTREILTGSGQESTSQSTSRTDPLAIHETGDEIRPNQLPSGTGGGQSVTPQAAVTVDRVPLQGYIHEDNEFKESPWARKIILAFDGGGIRGYSSLLILDHLMKNIQKLEQSGPGGVTSSSNYPWMDAISCGINSDVSPESDNFLPCHYFDYIAGTSTGGLSAIMLGRLRMSTTKALETYSSFGQSVFGKARWFHERSWLWYGRAKYPSQNVKKTLVDIIQKSKPGLTSDTAREEPFISPEHRSRTIAFSVCKWDGAVTPHLWRTYDHDQNVGGLEHLNPGPGDRVPIWQVARATSAAPFFFKDIEIGGERHVDGAVGKMNNPALRAFHGIGHKERYSPSLFISIGTGMKSEKKPEKKASRKRWPKFIKRYKDLSQIVEASMTETETTKGDWASACQANDTRWYRFNVNHGLGFIPLDDWRPAGSGAMTLREIERLTQDYITKDPAKKDLNECARYLFEARRSRAKTERWETFATDVEYYCPFRAYEKCKATDASHYRGEGCRNRLRMHLRNVHKDCFRPDSNDLDACINAGRLGPRPWSEDHEKTREKLERTASRKLLAMLVAGG